MRWRFLRSFEELKFEEPYPIFKSYVVPYRDDAGIIDYRRVKSEDVETYKDVLKKLREFLQSILGIEIVKSYDEVRKLELIGDLISLYFKIPLLKELFPSAILSPLKIYMLCRVHLVPGSYIKREPLRENPAEFIKGIYERKEEYLDIIQKLTSILANEKLCKDIEKSWFIFPSDTRPGFNTSGLIPHLLLTSAIAWSLATINKKLDRNKIAVLRLASLLHDIGKPFNYRQHVEPSKIVAEFLLNGLIPKPTLDKIVDIISKHHEPTDDLSIILRKADTMASTIDRVRQLVESYLKEDLESIAKELNLSYEDGLKTGDVAWDFWIKVYKERGLKIFEDLNSKFLNSLRKETDGFKSPVKPLREVEGERREEEYYRNVLVGVIDVAGIQKYISRSQEIKVTSGASLLIDYLVMAYAPFYIQSNMDEHDIWVPYESFIYTAGGVVEFVMPRLSINEFEKIAGDQLNGIISENGLKVTFAYAQFHDNMYVMMRELTNNLHLRKNMLKCESMKIERISEIKGSEDLCQLCYSDDAKLTLQLPGESKRTCRICKLLYDFGDEISFRERYEAKISLFKQEFVAKNVYDLDWKDANRYVIELISGHDGLELEKLKKKEVEIRDIAVLKIDGNLMGPFMATSISPTDMYERSARIDIALKNAVIKALNIIYESISKLHGNLNESAKPCISTLLGTLYVGGDDSLIIMPSWASIAFSWIVGNEFRLNMGESRGLSIGIAVGSAKANLWNLISAAHSLMSEGKKYVRDNPEYSVVMYDIAEGGTLNNLIVKERINVFTGGRVSIQPFTLSKDEDMLGNYVKLVFETSNYNEFIEKCYLASRYSSCIDTPNLRGKVEDVQDFMKDIRTGIIECVNRADTFITFIGLPQKDYELLKLFIVAIYSKRQYARFKEKGDLKGAKIYDIVSKLCFKGDINDLLKGKDIPRDLNSSFSDAYRMIKIVGGGVI
jgi:hypothetical protein